MWRSLARLVLRRPVAPPPGAEAFSYVGVVSPILGVFIGLSVIEIPILDLILRHTVPWTWVRYAALALGVWGVLWMIGLFASLRLHPHLLGADGLRIRNGTSVDVTLPWSAVATVGARYRSLPSSRTIQVEDDVLHICAGSQTSVDVVLGAPIQVPLPAGPSRPVREIRLYADDPAALVARARRHLPARQYR
ncbi:PH domain-containing protein [Micromonospora sp. PLK6-60]|uniref:PH domain-containing protein n=1 Tax=Micromonospora sp. PLK6-60 TaxID=2873383 RepID=UPI002102B154|nr:PH domain-containing protein [Micromonospora sp. PLK6-60]